MSESLCSDTGMAHLLPHFLYAPGPRTSDIVECVKHFRAGRWQRLWNEGLKNAGKLRDKRARLTSRPQKRSDRAKDTYAQKCANKGNLHKHLTNVVSVCSHSVSVCSHSERRYLRLLTSVLVGPTISGRACWWSWTWRRANNIRSTTT